jgi:hypothetical protein
MRRWAFGSRASGRWSFLYASLVLAASIAPATRGDSVVYDIKSDAALQNGDTLNGRFFPQPGDLAFLHIAQGSTLEFRDGRVWCESAPEEWDGDCDFAG